MAENTNIEWCHHTFNPWRGCTKVSPGCANCYADTLSARNPTTLGIWGYHGTRIVASHSMWNQPVEWNKTQVCQNGHGPYSIDAPAKDCPECGSLLGRPRVFCASLGDVFEDWTQDMRYPAKDDDGKPTTHTAWWHPTRGVIKAGQTSLHLHPLERPTTMQDVRDQLFDLIDATPNLDWLLLTKRPENILRMVPQRWLGKFPTNVWLGTSVENQATAAKRIPELLRIPAHIRFLSCEPLLGPVHLRRLPHGDESDLDALLGQIIHTAQHRAIPPDPSPKIHWVIAGGESGPGARPMHPVWATSLQKQCAATGTPFLFKQWGNWFPCTQAEFNPTITLPVDTRKNPDKWLSLENEVFSNIGKLKAGRLLHGHEHNGYPKSTP